MKCVGQMKQEYSNIGSEARITQSEATSLSCIRLLECCLGEVVSFQQGQAEHSNKGD